MARLAVAVLLGAVSVALAVGAAALPSEAGYQGVGANFLPWVVSLALGACAIGLGVQAALEPNAEKQPAAQPAWLGFAWLSAGMLANATLIQSLGFILSCALCFALAARGWRVVEGRALAWPTLAVDAGLGAAISAPVFWLFTKGLNVSLPALVAGGWI
jgi:putative tricarboxylic transport membrane protein